MGIPKHVELLMSYRSSRLLAPLIALALLGSCDRGRTTDADGEHESDSATLRRIATNQWYTERGVDDPSGPWSAEYRRYMLQVAAFERARWGNMIPRGDRTPELVNGASWVSLGPTQATFLHNGNITLNVTDAGRLRSIVPTANYLYIATAGGGVWRRDLSNNTWTPLTESLGSLSCGSLAVDPTNANVVYLGLGDPFDGFGIGLVKSTDGGNTWSDPVFLGDSLVIPIVVVDPNNPSVVLAGTDKGLYRSTDAGATWNLVNIATGVTNAPYVWSIDWTGGSKLVLALEASHSVTTGSTLGQVWTSADDGATWTQATGMTKTSGVGRITVAAAPSSRSTVYAMAAVPNATNQTDLADMFKSTDGGKTWTALNVLNKKYTNALNPTAGETSTVNGILNGQGWYNQLVLVDPTTPTTVYFAGSLNLVQTTDGGSTFTLLSDWLAQGNLPYVHADFHAGAFDASGTLFVGTDGGFFERTSATNNTWTDTLNVGVVSHLLYTVSSSLNNVNAVLGGMQDNGTRLREGTTSTFDAVIGGDGFGTNINRANAANMIGSIYNETIYKSTNSGTSWAQATTGIPATGLTCSACWFWTKVLGWPGDATGNTLYTFTNTIYKSTNYAGAWAALATSPVGSTGAVIRNIGVHATNANIIGAVGSGGYVWLSSNGGTSWTAVASGDAFATPPAATALPGSNKSLSWIEFDKTNSQIVYVASVAPNQHANHVWKSTNFGQSWTSIDGNGLPTGAPVNMITGDPTDATSQVLFAGTEVGVYRSTDGGATWNRYGAGLPLVSVKDIYISPDASTSLVRIATYGRGFWQLNGGPASNDFSISANPTTVSAVQGTSTMTTISTAVTAGAAQNVALTVVNLPTGTTATFSPNIVSSNNGSSTLTLNVGATTTPGTYTLTVTGVGQYAVHTTKVTLTVTKIPDDFSISANPTTVTVNPGASGPTMISTAVTSGSAQSVALTVTGLPTGATGTFTTTPINSGQSTTLTLASGTAAPGTYNLTVTGTGASATHSTPVTFVINPPPANDFSISANPTTVTVTAGASGMTTISTMTTSGSAQTVMLTASGLPTGATATFNPTSVTSGMSSTLTLASGTAAPGSYPITITGTGASATHTTTVTFVINAPNDFSITAMPSTVSVAQGASGTTTVMTMLTSGSAESVALTASGVPTGATATFNPTSVTAGNNSTLTLASGTAAAGSYTITITGTAASATHTTTVTFTITAPATNDFSLTASPTSLSVTAGGAVGTSTISSAVVSGTAESIALTASGMPSGMTATLGPTSVNAGASSTLTITAGASTAAGVYTVTVTGTAPSATHTTSVTVTVGAAQASDFGIAVGSSGVSVVQGASGTAPVTTTVVSGAPETVMLAATGLPAGASASFTPASVTSGNGATLTLTAGATTTPGSYTITVTGTAASGTHMATLTLNVLAAVSDDFGVSAAPSQVTVAPGASGATTIATTLVTGNAQAVQLTVDGLPAGATGSFDNANITVGQSATLTLTAASTTAAGTYMLTVTATGSSATHTTTVAFEVTGGGGGGGSGSGGGKGGCGCTVGAAPDPTVDIAGGLAALALGILLFGRRRVAGIARHRR
jgi:MYXO-CTERM domain-containing protein